MNPDFPIRKKEAHKKRLMENAFMKGILTSNKAHIQQLEEKTQPLTEMSVSMTALLVNTDDANPQTFQDKMKKLVANFNKHSVSPNDA